MRVLRTRTAIPSKLGMSRSGSRCTERPCERLIWSGRVVVVRCGIVAVVVVVQPFLELFLGATERARELGNFGAAEQYEDHEQNDEQLRGSNVHLPRVSPDERAVGACPNTPVSRWAEPLLDWGSRPEPQPVARRCA